MPIRRLVTTLSLLCFAFWFGGFGFYVSAVVPIGTEVLGTALDQGMITRRVTVWLNISCAVATIAMLYESFRVQRTAWMRALPVIILLLLLGLVILHPMLDRMIDPVSMDIDDAAKFYQMHRIYLWLSTFQWIAAWLWAWCYFGESMTAPSSA